MLKNSNQYKLRKLTIGLVSVCAGVLFMTQNKQMIKADTTNQAVSPAVEQTRVTNKQENLSQNTNQVEDNKLQPDLQINSSSNLPDSKQGNNVQAKSAVNSISASQKSVIQKTKAVLINVEQEQNNNVNKQEVNQNGKGTGSAVNTNQQENNQETLNVKSNANPISKSALSESKAVNSTLPVSDTNDAYALNPANNMHEHIDINDNGGYNADFWGKIDCSKWNVIKSGNTLSINGYNGGAITGAVIIPNLNDFKQAGLDQNAIDISISRQVLADIAGSKNADYDSRHNRPTALGISKTGNGKVKLVSSDNRTDSAFQGARFEIADVSALDISGVQDLGYMFESDKYLRNLDIAGWNVSHIQNFHDIFSNDNALQSLDVTNWNITASWDGTFGIFGRMKNVVLTINSGPMATYLSNTNRCDDSLSNAQHTYAAMGTNAIVTNDAKLISVLTPNECDKATTHAKRTITVIFPKGYIPDMGTVQKYGLIKNGNNWQIDQSIAFNEEVYISIKQNNNYSSHTAYPSELYVPDTSTTKGVTITSGTAAYDAVDLPSITGYDTPKVTMAEADSGKNVTQTVGYILSDESVLVNFVDDNNNQQVIGTPQTVSGKYGTQADFSRLTLPVNYVLSGTPSYKFTADASQTYTIHLKHATQDVHLTDPNAKNVRTYRVVEKLPDGTQKVVLQIDGTFYKPAIKDLVTGKVTYGLFYENSNAGGYAYVDDVVKYSHYTGTSKTNTAQYYNLGIGYLKYDELAGYTIHFPDYSNPLYFYTDFRYPTDYWKPDKGTFTLDLFMGPNGDGGLEQMPANEDLYITYTANPQSVKVNFVDDDNKGITVGTVQTLTGITDGQADFSKLTVPTNYVEVATPSYKFNANTNQTYTIHLKHQTQTITYNAPSATVTGAKQNDLNSVGTRTISFFLPNSENVNDFINQLKTENSDLFDNFDVTNGNNVVNANGQTVRLIQTVHFIRNAVLDKVTGNVTYASPNSYVDRNNWCLDTSKNKTTDYGAVKIPKIAGYTPKLQNKNGLLMMLFVANPVQPTMPINKPTTPSEPSTKPVAPTKPNVTPVSPTKPAKPNSKPISGDNNDSSISFNKVDIIPSEPASVNTDLHLVNEKKLERIIARRMRYLVKSSKNFSIVYHDKKIDIKHAKA